VDVNLAGLSDAAYAQAAGADAARLSAEAARAADEADALLRD
jgi:hypothetical protein